MKFLGPILFIILTFLPVNSFAQKKLTIATFNTWMIPALRKRANDRAKIIGSLATKYDAIFFQELFNKKQRNIIKSKMSNHKSHYQKSRGLKLNSGLFNSSQLEILEKSFMKFSDCAKAQCLSSKGALRTRIKLGVV